MEEKGKKTEEIIRKEAGKTSSTAGGSTPEEKANMQRMMKHLPQAPSRPDPEEDPPPRRAILKENRHGMAPDGGDEDDVETVEMKMKMIAETVEMKMKKIVETVEMEVKKIVATEDKGGEKGAEGGKKGKYHPHRTQWTEAEVVEWLGNTHLQPILLRSKQQWRRPSGHPGQSSSPASAQHGSHDRYGPIMRPLQHQKGQKGQRSSMPRTPSRARAR